MPDYHYPAFAMTSGIKGQADTVRNPEQFLFPEFYVGVAKMLNGEKVVLNLNYNIITEKMVFMQKNQIFDIVNQETIDTVYIEGRRFIPRGKVFNEVLADGKATFFVQHKGSVRKPSRPAAYGGYIRSFIIDICKQCETWERQVQDEK